MEKKRKEEIIEEMKKVLANHGEDMADESEYKNLTPAQYATLIEEWEEAHSMLITGKKYSLAKLKQIFGSENVTDAGDVFEIRYKHIGVQWNEDYLEDCTQLATVVEFYNDKGKMLNGWVDMDYFDHLVVIKKITKKNLVVREQSASAV